MQRKRSWVAMLAVTVMFIFANVHAWAAADLEEGVGSLVHAG